MDTSLCSSLQALDIATNDAYYAAVDRLALWLKQNAPQNVMMPVSIHRTPSGDSLKAPARAHKGGTHTWAHYDAYRLRVLAPGQPIGILMRDLICVDIDDASLVPVWEAKYPCLLSSARETTRKGTHYIFRRSPKCDAIALTNGAGQFQDDAGDDLLVAPWDIDLPSIPDSFVEALEKMRERKLYKKKKGGPRECDPHRLAAIAHDQALRNAGIDPDVVACLHMLSPQRAEDYNSWLGVGFTLKACGLQYEPLWHDWSRLSDKYDPVVASSKWASFPSDSQPAPKDWLCRAARSDSPDAYNIFAKSSTEDAIFQSVLQEGSHVSVAQVFRSLFPDTYVWLRINKGHSYYHFNDVKWMEFDDPAPIKNLLTTQLVPLIEKAAKDAEEQWTSNKKDKDADPPPTVTLPRSIARRPGDCSFRNSVCTEIATLYFDATLSFFDRLDADHNLLAFDDC
ncbi:g3446 [Coccomyxa elongata]